MATSTELVRHLDFEPGLLGDLTERGQLVHGGYPLPATRPEAIEADRLARLTWAAFEYSALLAPSLLSPHQSSQLHLGLQSLYEDLSDETPRPSLAPAEMLGYIYKELGNDIDGQAAWDYRPDIRTSEPLPMPGLVAVYEKQQELILVVAEEWSTDFAAKATTTNWDRLSERAVGHYRAIRVTTPGQLRLIVTNDDVADFFLGYYSRIWGSDVLANVEVRHRRVLQNLGRWPSYLAVAEMSQLLVSSDDSELFMLVHDLQNRLLNVQLRNELFSRRLGLAPQTPPIALPEPSAPARQRLEAVSIHLHGWADHYWEAMCAVDEQLLLPA
ncbi:MAG: hypothetical protein R3300_09040 [Candidatus Promineifilaceae bacterium]|nr:hypothetical protein [Candidatus Promineifilaceae bacterium]